MIRRALALVLAAAAVAAVGAQQPTFRSGVELVQVDVVVVDHNGQHVRGLKAADFVVLDRKKTQAIATFEEVTHERLPAASVPSLLRPARLDVSNNQTARSERLVVMVVDDLHIHKGRTERARSIARDIIAKLGAQASMAVLFTSATRTTQVTEDRAELLAAVETIQGKQSVRRPHQARDDQKAPPGDAEMDSLKRLDAIGEAQQVSLQHFFDNLTQYKTLEDAARILGADDARRKAFVLLSEGIGKDLTGMFDAALTPCESRGGACFHDQALAQMMESLRRSNVTTYAIDPRGHVSPQDLATEAFPGPPGLADDPATGGFRWNNPIRQAQDGLAIMAEATGGFAVTDTDDFTSGIERVIEDLDHYYLLGFYPNDPGGKGYRPLDVSVRGHPEWTIRFRKGYRPGGPPAPPVNSDPLAALASGVLPRTDLALRLFATAFPGDRKTAHVTAAIEVTAPTQTLLGSDGKLHDEVSYGIIVVDDKKAKVASQARRAARIVLKPRVPVVREPASEMPGQVAYQIPVALDLHPGQYQLRASVTSAKLARGGSVYLTLQVPEPSREPIAIAGVLLGYADGERVPVADVPRDRFRRGVGGPLAPSLDRTFAAADTIRLYFEVVRKNAARPLTAKIDIVDDRDDVRAWVDRPVPAGDPGRVDVKLPLSTLSAGAYRLRLTATDGAYTAGREIGFTVAAPAK
jgi:VWFA-related protein